MSSAPKTDPVRGMTLRWTYDDGAMAGKTYEHTFGTDGTVRWSEAGKSGGETGATAVPDADTTAAYTVERLNDDLYVVSYLAKSGYTLTTVVDTKAGTIVSVASNEKQLMTLHGRIEGTVAA